MELFDNATAYLRKYAYDLDLPQLKRHQPNLFWIIGIVHIISLSVMPIIAIYAIHLTFKMRVLHRNLLNLLRLFLFLHIVASPIRAMAIFFSVFDQYMESGALIHALSVFVRNTIFLTDRALLVAFACERFIASLKVNSYEKSNFSIIWILLSFSVITIGIFCSIFSDTTFLPVFSGVMLLVTGGVLFVFSLYRTWKLRLLKQYAKGSLPLATSYQIEENWRGIRLVLIFGVAFFIHYFIGLTAHLYFNVIRNDSNFLMFTWYIYAQSSLYSLFSTIVPIIAIDKYREYTLSLFGYRKQLGKVAPTDPQLTADQFFTKLEENWNRTFENLGKTRNNYSN